MKNWVKKIGQNKFQFFFFVGVLALLLVALVLASTIPANDNPNPNNPDNPDNPNPSEVVTSVAEKVNLPFKSDLEYQVVRKFYEKDGTKEDQEKSLIKYGTSYRTSMGTSFAAKDNKPFDVTAALSGTVTEIKESPLYGNFVVIEHKDGLKTYYYSLSEVTIAVGATVNQGTKIGVSGESEIDKEAGNHVYFKVLKENKHLNHEKVIGQATNEI